MNKSDGVRGGGLAAMGAMVGHALVARARALGCFAAVLVGGFLALCACASPALAEGASFQFGPMGEEAGQIGIFGSNGMAIDHTSGDIYVSDFYNNRVEQWDQSGNFIRAWGWGVATGANEFQICTTTCLRAQEGLSGAGAVAYPEGMAVDQSSGDVYVVEFGNHRVDKFDSSGKFILMFGGHVNKNGTNVCTAAEAAECQAGTEGTGDGEFSEVYERAYIAVGPSGRVYVGDRARVQVFEPSGAWAENISLSALSSEGKVTALAVNAVGDVYLKDEGVPGVREFEPPLYLESSTKLDEGSEAVESIALDEGGDVFISEDKASYGEPCTCDFKEYSASGQELEVFGGHTLDFMNAGLAVDGALDELLVFGTDAELGNSEYGHRGIWSFPMPPPGPLVEPGSERATPELRGAITLAATVNPEGYPTEITFEYVDEAKFKAGGYAGAAKTTPVSLNESGFSDQPVEVKLPQKSLVPGVTYHWRVAAHNPQGTNAGPDQSFEEIPPAYTEGPWAAHVTGTSTTLWAKIDPLGASTSYRLEYGKGASYEHVLSGNVGEGMEYVQVGYHIQELEPHTTYHYRLVTESEVGVVEGADHLFTTQLLSGALALPDGRAWELVSPPDKGGALIEDIERAQAASDGSGIAYAVSEPMGEGISGHVGENLTAIAGATVISRRSSASATGWSTRDISPKQGLPPEGEAATELLNAAEAFYTYSPDLSSVAVEPRWAFMEPLSKEATELTLYVRNNTDNSWQPLVWPGNVPSEVKWHDSLNNGDWQQMNFEAATPDLSHILFSDWAALTPEAKTEPGAGNEWVRNLYEWSDGALQLVNILPDETTQPGVNFGTNDGLGSPSGASPWAMSSDGRWIVFRYGQLASTTSWYVRDMSAHVTVPLGRPNGHSLLETMSRDGSKIFYIEPESSARSGQALREGELYLFDPATGATTDLTPNHLAGERSAGVQDTLMGISEDGTYVYLVAKGVLANGGVRGQNNLYVLHDQAGQWTTTFVATLSGDDEKDWHSFNGFRQLEAITSRVSPDGRYATFMSDRSLTGYDNRDVLSGEPDEEVYLYDAASAHLVCVSCNPTGGRPIGVHDQRGAALLMDQIRAWSGLEEPRFEQQGHWLAADIEPDWHSTWKVSFYRPRYLSDTGRLFFDSADALVPQDTNGLADVYEYEPAGEGSCGREAPTFSEAANGCVNLISSGQSSTESTFLDASESGRDVFFITAAKLVGADYDNANDVYDAHVCTAEVPCRAEPVAPPACTSGDSCKAAPSPQPEGFGAGPSETFNGTGNVTTAATPVVKATSERGKKRCVRSRTRRRGRCVRKKRRQRRHARRNVTGKAIRRGRR